MCLLPALLLGLAARGQTLPDSLPSSLPAEDPPLLTVPTSGGISGVIRPAEKLAKLELVCRATGKRYAAARLDRRTGAFEFRDLPGDAAYDLCLVTADGARIEGIDLSWHEERMLRLAGERRRQLGLAERAEKAFAGQDAQELLKYVRDLKDFADTRRVLCLRGDAERAAMLVEVMRARDFYARKGDEVIWRTELWYFEYHYGGWERVPDVERVLERQRIPGQQWEKITLAYVPELSVRISSDGKAPAIEFTIPEKLVPNTSRLAGTAPEQKTTPLILGVPPAATGPASEEDE